MKLDTWRFLVAAFGGLRFFSPFSFTETFKLRSQKAPKFPFFG